MKESIQSHNSDKESNSPENEQVSAIVSYVKNYGLTGDELYMAYKIVLGIEDSEGSGQGKVREEVRELAKMIDEKMNEGLSASVIKKMIEGKQQLEDGPETYYAFVDSLAINDKGKRTLKSIIEKGRSGTLIVNDLNDPENGDEIEIPAFAPNIDKGAMAILLRERLEKYKDSKINFSFNE